MRTSQDGVDLIREFESCSLSAYQDRGGIWTIGWGHTSGVCEGDTCTQAQADAWLAGDIRSVEKPLETLLAIIPVNQRQWDALVSFCFNVGFGTKGVKSGFEILKSGEPSTLLKLLALGQYVSAADELLKWNRVAGAICPGIERRRVRERALFLEVPHGETRDRV